MAIISSLIGGFCGFLTFVTALTFFNVGFFSALGLYVLVGLGLTCLIIVAGLTWRTFGTSDTLSPAREVYAKRSG